MLHTNKEEKPSTFGTAFAHRIEKCYRVKVNKPNTSALQSGAPELFLDWRSKSSSSFENENLWHIIFV